MAVRHRHGSGDAELGRFNVPSNLGENTATRANDGGIYYIGDEGSFSNIWLQPADVGRPRRHTRFADRSISGFALSPERTRIAVARNEVRSDVVVIRNTASE